MLTTINFLSADVALTKTFTMSGGKLVKSAYPNVRDFTSFSFRIQSIQEFFNILVAQASKGNCLLKGTLQRKLVIESRAGSTTSDATTQWVCLDIDAADVENISDILAHIDGLKDVSHIVQYSSSYGINGSKKLSAHVFFLLDKPLPPDVLKAWLMEVNLCKSAIRRHIGLTKTAAYLHWPVDITACQNDKLLYIAPPVLVGNVPCDITPGERFKFVLGKKPEADAEDFITDENISSLKNKANQLRNDLRTQMGLDPIRIQTRWVGEYEIQPKPGEATITGARVAGEFTYLNLNGGDSWGYYFPNNNIEYLHNFKGEPVYLMREILPTYYKSLKAKERQAREEETEEGSVILAFRDKRSASYVNGIWNPQDYTLELWPAKSELQLNHWMQHHGKPPHEVIPVWDKQFLPNEDFVVDVQRRRINTFVPTEYLRQMHKPTSLNDCPLIKRIMLHAVSNNVEDETFEHWLNWLACVVQFRTKTQTAWVLHGTEGTGKGLIVNKVLAPILGRNHVQSKRVAELTDQFNGWLEEAIVAFIDEMEIDALVGANVISATLRTCITDSPVTIRHMRQTAVQMENYTNFIFSSNKNKPVQIAGENDRRYNVGAFQPKRLDMTRNEVEVDLLAELPAFTSYLMTREANLQKATLIIKNDARKALIYEAKTSIDVLVDNLRNGELSALYESKSQQEVIGIYGQRRMDTAIEFNKLVDGWVKDIAKNVREGSCRITKTTINDVIVDVVDHKTFVTRDQLMVVFEHCIGGMPETPNKFTSMLKHKGVLLVPRRINKDKTTALEVTWRTTLAWLSDVTGSKPNLKVVNHATEETNKEVQQQA